MEALFAIAIVCLSALGIAFGLLVGRAPPTARCGDCACTGTCRKEEAR